MNGVQTTNLFFKFSIFKKTSRSTSSFTIFFRNPIDSLNTLIETDPSITDIYFNTDETSIDGYLYRAEEIKRNGTDYYKVYTPYYKKWIEKSKEKPLKVNLDQVTVKQKILFDAEEKNSLNF